jgi:hypothetical protein
MTKIIDTIVQPLLRPRSASLLRTLILTALALAALPTLQAQTLKWNTTVSFTGTANIDDPPSGANLPTTVILSGTGTVTATPVGGGQYDITSIINVSSLDLGVTGIFAPFDVSGGGFTYTLAGYDTTLANLPPGAALTPGSGYTGTITSTGSGPNGGFSADGISSQYFFVSGATAFDLGDGTVPATSSGGVFTYGDASLSLNMIVGGLDPDYSFSGTASATFTSLNSTVSDSSSILAEVLIVLAFGFVFIRLNTAEAKPACIPRQQ